jgi:peptidoglycan/xylan/chitin deacetylase (PgdA/CDA1 family)
MNKRVRNLIAGAFGIFMHRIGYIDAVERNIPEGSILPLCFHNPERRKFVQLIHWLKGRSYSFISTHELIDILEGRTDPSGRNVWITFDDGWRGNMDAVIPTIVANNIPATFFLTTGPIEEKDGVFWWNLMRANRACLPEQYRYNVKGLWQLPEVQRRQIVEEVSKCAIYHMERQAMTEEDVLTISRLPQVTIGCHTVRHGLIPNYTDSELEDELCEAMNKLTQWSARAAPYFAYPKGVFDGGSKDILKRCGFVIAATTEVAIIGKEASLSCDLYRIPRIPVPDEGYFSELLCHALGIWQPIITRLKFCEAIFKRMRLKYYSSKVTRENT